MWEAENRVRALWREYNTKKEFIKEGNSLGNGLFSNKEREQYSPKRSNGILRNKKSLGIGVSE
jgi:hypothetical protein